MHSSILSTGSDRKWVALEAQVLHGDPQSAALEHLHECRRADAGSHAAGQGAYGGERWAALLKPKTKVLKQCNRRPQRLALGT